VRTLIADDDPIAARMLRRLVETAGHTVDHASDGLAAWALYEQHTHPLVISDWMMPQLDGLDLCRRIRAHAEPRGAYPYLVLVTARADRSDRLVALGAGVDDFLTKPLDQVDFLARLRAAERILAYQRSLAEANARLRAHQAAQQRQAAMVQGTLAHAAALMAALREQQAALAATADPAAPLDFPDVA
jgi:sigma-B regulation protein RsbU (phosphoserine phosphatase)